MSPPSSFLPLISFSPPLLLSPPLPTCHSALRISPPDALSLCPGLPLLSALGSCSESETASQTQTTAPTRPPATATMTRRPSPRATPRPESASRTPRSTETSSRRPTGIITIHTQGYQRRTASIRTRPGRRRRRCRPRGPQGRRPPRVAPPPQARRNSHGARALCNLTSVWCYVILHELFLKISTRLTWDSSYAIIKKRR